MRRALVLAIALALTACDHSGPATPRAFERWIAAEPARAESLARFETLLAREGVSDVFPVRELWFVDRIDPECVVEQFVIPPEEMWPNIVPTLRYIRDHVVPAIGPVTVASGYRDPDFNACIEGASRSAHRGFHAPDLFPRDPLVTRERLIAVLCPIHAAEGRRLDVGMGIYRARRFHIDAHGYRGWGEDFRGATFPCTAERAP